jgi:hypothetical protein
VAAVRGNGGRDTATATWTNNATTNVTSLVVQYATASNFAGATNVNIANTTTTTTTISGLRRGQTYWFRVGAVNATGTAYSNSMSALTP